MIKLITYITFGLSIILFACNVQTFDLIWQNENFLKIPDHKLREPLRFYDQKTFIQYNITNDSKNLYITIKATDSYIQSKILKAGFVISIDTSLKKNNACNLYFPVPNSEKLNLATDEIQSLNNNNIEYFKTMFISTYREIFLDGFKNISQKNIPMNNEYGIIANLHWDSLNIMYYRAVIPFKFFLKDEILKTDTAKILDLKFTINPLPKPESSKTTQQENEQSNNNSVLNQGYGTYNNPQRRTQEPINRDYEPEIIFSRVKLAAANN